MAHFEDLSPCAYFPGGDDRLVAVGWLEREHPFPRGEVDADFFAALVRLCVEPWQPVVFAGRHACSLCRFSGGPGALSYDSLTVSLGSANVFVPDGTRVFVAPTTVLHYLDAHGYTPPREFQEAVLRCPPMRSMPYLRALKESGLSFRR
ncbi:hypothetical protein VZQ01_03915 [Myxococcus faecalis]|jgi:hypothetical protein|uniref:DUF7919 family protein n=1 Tax=Myxococcus faecalis TaxID=3115646 RepID=UPI003CE8833A